MERLRSAKLDDAEAMLEIYTPYVTETAVSFEIEVPTLREFRSRMIEREGKFPWLVYEKSGEVLGYAYAGPFKDRKAYEWSVEATIYVKRGLQRTGIGKALYGELLKISKAQGVLNVIGGITLPNEGSVGLHESFGFLPVAIFKDAGFKLGRWWDVGYWQLQFENPGVPKPLRRPVLSAN